jgi:F0F1-type ATP synthase assembly protein I
MPSDNKPENSNSQEPAADKAKNFSNQFGLAMELPFVLVAAVVLGGGMGYFLDRWLHTKMIFTLLLGGIGFFAGIRDILRRFPGSKDGSSRS